MSQLYAWQRPNAEKLAALIKGGMQFVGDFSSTGTGKSYIAAEVLRLTGLRALVICPKIAKTAWIRVAKDMGVLDKVLNVTNPEKLKTGKLPYFHDGKWEMPSDAFIIADEFHRGTSGIDTDTGKMFALTRAYKIPVLALSATLADSPLKLRTAGYLAGLHDYSKGSFYNWCRANGCFKSKWHSGMEFVKGPRGRAIMAEIHQKLADRVVRLKLQDIPDFPEGLVEAKLFDLDQRATDEINAIWAALPEEVRKGGGGNPLTESLRARQQTEALKVPLFAELVQEALEEDKAVVAFLCFRESLFALEKALKAAGVTGISLIYGGQKEEERQAGIDMFQANLSNVCLAMCGAGGIAVSLHDVKQERERTSLINPSWSAVEMTQCLGRIHRSGGTPVLQTFVLAAGTVEEKVYEAINRKRQRIASLNDGDLAP